MHRPSGIFQSQCVISGVSHFNSEALSAPAAHKLARMVYDYGGEPVASFLPPSSNIVLKPSVVHAMFMDVTHNHDPGHIQVCR